MLPLGDCYRDRDSSSGLPMETTGLRLAEQRHQGAVPMVQAGGQSSSGSRSHRR